MGIIAHHAIIVTGCYGDWPEKAWEKASAIFPEEQVSPLSDPVTNGYQSFAVFPDGSKEGWEASASGDMCRDAFVAWLRAQAYDDGSSPLSWVEVSFGELRHRDDAVVTRHAWDAKEHKSAEQKGATEK